MRRANLGGLPIDVLEEGETVDEKGAIILCMRQSEVKVPSPGSGEADCSRCGEKVWLHSTKAAPTARVVCDHCFMDMMQKELN